MPKFGREFTDNVSGSEFSFMKNAVFFTVNRNFLPLALATASVVAAKRGKSYDVLILLDGEMEPGLKIPDGVQVLPNKLVDRIPDATGYKRPWGAVAYTRILAPLELGNKYRRLLYLDSDIAAFGSVEPLFRLDMGEYPLAAVEGMMEEGTILSGFDMQSYKQGLGVGNNRMFNSGMLLIDVDNWCRIDHEQSLHHYVTEVQPKLKVRTGLAGDQEYLNRLLAGQWLLLSPLWNFQTVLMMLALEAVVDPVLVHYTGNPRPWVHKLYPFGARHVEYYERNFRRIGFDGAARFRPADYNRRLVTNTLRRFWFDRVNVAAKRRNFEIWRSARNAYRRAISDRLEQGDYADIAQGLASLDLADDPLADVGLDEIGYYRKHIWPKRLAH